MTTMTWRTSGLCNAVKTVKISFTFIDRLQFQGFKIHFYRAKKMKLLTRKNKIKKYIYYLGYIINTFTMSRFVFFIKLSVCPP